MYDFTYVGIKNRQTQKSKECNSVCHTMRNEKWGVTLQWLWKFTYTREISSKDFLYKIVPVVNNTFHKICWCNKLLIKNTKLHPYYLGCYKKCHGKGDLNNILFLLILWGQAVQAWYHWFWCLVKAHSCLADICFVAVHSGSLKTDS